MHALVVNPWITDFKLYDEWMHPVGLYFLISLLRHNNYDISYYNCLQRNPHSKPKRFGTGMFEETEIDSPLPYRSIPRRYRRFGVSDGRLREELAAIKRPDVIFVGSSMTYWIEGVAATVAVLSRAFPGVPLVVGGISAVLIPKVLRAYTPGAHIFSSPLLPDRGHISVGPSIPPLDTNHWTPSLLPAFRILENLRHGPLLMSLGCPMKCGYCASARLSGPFRSRSLGDITEEVSYLAIEKGVRTLASFDDALLFRAEEHFCVLADRLAEIPVESVHVPNGLHLRYVTPQVAHAMRTARFHTLRFGYESGAKVHSSHTSGKTSAGMIETKLQILFDAGFSPDMIGVYVMGGLPDQSPRDMLKEIEHVAQSGVKPKPVFFSPVPGTDLFEHYRAIIPEIQDNPLYHNDILFAGLLPGWSYQAVEEIRKAARQLGDL